MAAQGCEGDEKRPERDERDDARSPRISKSGLQLSEYDGIDDTT